MEKTVTPSGNPWKPAISSAGIALALVIAAGCVHYPPDFLARLFGPPAVAMVEAYTAAKLDEHLRDQARIVHTDGTRWLQYDAERNRLSLTRLYQWYAGDYEQVAGSVEAYVARYFEPVAEALEAGNPPRIEYLEYDWSLNDQENLS